MAQSLEVVMLFGPPFAGKTAYYKHHLKRSHERVSAVDLFREDSDLGLRQVILKIVSLLKQGKRVVIDDENWSKSTRLSYVKSISAKVPNCKFRCIKFNTDGPLALHWLQEWSLAKSILSCDERSLDDWARCEARISRWFGDDVTGRRPEIPTAEEGISLQDIQVKLVADDVDYKFEVPALFIEWEGICQQKEDGTNRSLEGTREVLQTWTSCNPWGRIIIISHGSCSDDAISKVPDNWTVISMKQALMDLCQSLPSPVYFYHHSDPKSSPSFATPPQPGTLAFLQRFHHIHLWHRGTLYLYHTMDHADGARAAGVNCLKAAAALQSPSLVCLSQCSAREDPDPILKDIKLIGHSELDQQRSTPRIPLYSDAVASGEKVCFVLESDCRRTLGICFRDRNTLDRYQELYAETATKIMASGTKMVTCIPDNPVINGQRQITDSVDSSQQEAVTSQQPITLTASKPETQQTTRGLPSWMLSQSLKKTKKVDRLIGGESFEDSSLEEPARKKKSDVSPLLSTVYCMSPAELCETAWMILKEDHDLDSSRQADREDSSLSRETQELRTITKDASILVNHSEDSISAESRSDMHTESGGEEARLLDDIFMVSSPGMKPPPRKAKFPKKSQKYSNSSSARPECYAPETVMSVPETAGYTAASIGPKESTIALVGESSTKQIETGTKESRGPDFSFLDDIF
ncbi:uncharacterized protein LOC110973903 [Acanthaster planci]|uniref:Uncharacterized protein LOC110973903 n=1 Tax=Acanthaster planci TaxID=133434 RepID=A0A8B7XKZ5_ACAPL|nr:uncharacterized protein LOC110973903 [Acanthaster planci]